MTALSQALIFWLILADEVGKGSAGIAINIIGRIYTEFVEFEDLVIVHLEGRDVQFNAALNKKTGETVWKYPIAEKLYAKVEPTYMRKAYDTPIVVQVNGKPQLVSNGSQLAAGYDPRTGKELWRVVYGDDNTISSCILSPGAICPANLIGSVDRISSFRFC